MIRTRKFSHRRKRRVRRLHHRRPIIESLEGRRLLATFAVRNTFDSGGGSFRQAILDANSNPGKDVIEFDFSSNPGATMVTQFSLATQSGAPAFLPPALPDSVALIRPRSSLPEITDPVVIDGTKDVLSLVPLPGVEIRGDRLNGSASGLRIRTDDCEIRGLIINSFPGYGISIRDGQNNILNGNYVGVHFENNNTKGNRDGIGLIKSDHNTFTGNYVVDSRVGINLDEYSDHNTFERNTIANSDNLGIFVQGAHNQIGGGENSGNVIVDNGRGILIDNRFVESLQQFVGGHDNAIQGNRIISNGTGVSIATGAVETLIGGGNRSAGNVISANNHGIIVSGENSHTSIHNNLIGTDLDGDTGKFADDSATGNELFGIHLRKSTGNDIRANVIGRTNPLGGFIAGGDTAVDDIAPVSQAAIWLDRSHSNTISANRIGINLAGTAALANHGIGLLFSFSADNLIENNFISSTKSILFKNETGHGLYFQGLGSTGNTVVNNIIGANTDGTAPLANERAGVVIRDAPGNFIGGAGIEGRNLISGNGKEGVLITGESASGNLVQGNYIGTTLAGDQSLPNGQSGITIVNAPNTVIGGDRSGEGNVVSGNQNVGIEVFGALSAGSELQGNMIGTDPAGIAPVPNQGSGILLAKTTEILVGGTTTMAGNLIGFHADVGLGVQASSANTIQGNGIGVLSVGTAGGNQVGILLQDSPSNQIGGATAGAENIVGSNQDVGVFIAGAESTGNRIEGNRIGGADRGNAIAGIVIIGASNNSIGGVASGKPNQIIDNGKFGVVIGAADQTAIINNTIRLNEADGIKVSDSQAATITGNSISGNGASGVLLSGERTLGTVVLENDIVDNQADGISVIKAASSNQIADNVIRGNQRNGVWLADGTNNLVVLNSIYDNGGLGIDLDAEGPTPNDTGDGDDGANLRQNAPVLASVDSVGGETTIQGSLNTTPNTEVLLQFFANRLPSGDGFGQGETFLGQTTLITDDNGNALIDVAFPAELNRGVTVAATATTLEPDTVRRTSEFSNSVQIPVAETQANVTSAGFQDRQDIAMAPNGSYVVAWKGAANTVYFRRFDATGTPLDDTDRQVNTTAGAFIRDDVSIAMDAVGNFVVVWMDQPSGRPNGFSLLGEIFYRRFDAAGNPVDAQQRQANSIEAGQQAQPTVDMADDGSFAIAWESGDDLGPDRPVGDGDYRGIFARRFDANGDPVDSEEFQVNTEHEGDQAYPAISVEGDRLLVAWTDGTDPFARNNIMARQYDDDGPLGDAFQLNTQPGLVRNFISDVDVDFAATGAWVATWLNSAGHPVFRRFDSAGLPLDNQEVVGSEIVSESWPRVAVGEPGNFVLSYVSPEELSGGSFDPDTVDVFLRRFSSAGQPLGEEFRVHDFTTEEQRDPAVAINPAGDVGVAWVSLEQDGDRAGVFARAFAFDTDIRLHEFTANGASTLSLTYSISAGPVTPFDVQIVRSSDDQFDASDVPLASIAIPQNAITSGEHTLTYAIGDAPGEISLPGAGAEEVAEEYFLLAVADPQDVVYEDDTHPLFDDNTLAFVGAYHPRGGVVHVHGGRAGDSVAVAEGSVEVTLNGRVHSYAQADVAALHIRGHAGDDQLMASPTMPIGIRAWGGPGDDILHGGAGDDLLDGGAGDDEIFGGEGSDSLFGDAGNDLLDGGGGEDQIDGGSGDNTAVFDDADSVTNQLVLSIQQSQIAENEGAAATIATVRRPGDLDTADLLVTVTIDDRSEAAAPTTVLIPAGQTSATFPIDVIDDNILDGTQTVTIGVVADGLVGNSIHLDVIDSESLFVEINVNEVSELAGSATVTVTRSNLDFADELEVQLSTTRGDQVTGVPSVVTLAANRRSVSFDIVAIDNEALDGPRTVAISASAAGYQDGQIEFDVIDDERDPILYISGSRTFDLAATSDAELEGIETIDIQGSDEQDDNTLLLNVSRITSAFANQTLTVIANTDDAVIFDDGWMFTFVERVNGGLARRFEQAGATVILEGPKDLTNPISNFDVNASGDITALDALQVVNELGRRVYSDGSTDPPGAVRHVNEFDLSEFKFFDVTGDLRITALDALRVINELGRQAGQEQPAEGEMPLLWRSFSVHHDHSTRDVVEFTHTEPSMPRKPVSNDDLVDRQHLRRRDDLFASLYHHREDDKATPDSRDDEWLGVADIIERMNLR